MALRPVLRACAVTTLAAALTATTAFPAAASPIVPPSAPDPARGAAGQQVASEVKGEEQQTISVDGIDPEALQSVEQDPTPSAEATDEPHAASESGRPTPQAAARRAARPTRRLDRPRRRPHAGDQAQPVPCKKGGASQCDAQRPRCRCVA